MKQLPILILLLASSFLTSMAQSELEAVQKEVEIYWNQQDFETALVHAQKAVSIAAALGDSIHRTSLKQLNVVAQNANAYDIAEAAGNTELQIIERNQGKESYDYINLLLNTSEFYQKIGTYTKAEKIALEAMNVAESAFGTQHNLYAAALSALGSIYNTLTEHKKAELFILKAHDIIVKVKGKNSKEYAGILANLAKIYNRLEEYEKAEAYTIEACALKKKIWGPLNPEYANSMNDLAMMLSQRGKYEEALESYQIVLDIDAKTIGTHHPYYAMSLNNIGGTYQRMRNLDKAAEYYSRALAIKKKTIGPYHLSTMYSLSDLGAIAVDQDNFGEAYTYFFEGIANNCHPAILPEEVPKKIQTLFEEHNFRNAGIGLQLLLNLAEAFEKDYNVHKKTALLIQAYEVSLATNAYIQKRVLELSDKNDQLFLLRYAALSFSFSIRVAEKLYAITKDKKYIEATIGFAEQNKSILLSNTLNNEKSYSFGGVPDSIAQKERALKEQIEALQSKIITASNQGDSIRAEATKLQLVKAALEKDAFKAFLEKHYPRYVNINQQHKTIQVTEIQDVLLDKETVLVEYFIRKGFSYIIVVTKEDCQLFPIEFKNNNLTYRIAQLRKSLSDYTFIQANKDNAFREFTESSHFLYNKLIQPIEAILKGKKKLLIIPDQQLGHIPFEVLLPDSDLGQKIDYANLPYLLKTYSISYSYSASLLLENKRHQQRHNNGQVLGFAAHYPDLTNVSLEHLSNIQQKTRRILDHLPATQAEVKSLEKTFAGLYYYKNEATEAAFKGHAQEYSVLHLAMHGILNKEHPLLSAMAFSEANPEQEDNFLEAHEISNMRLNADLVVLSACETGYGKFEQGEGVLSLARSFMYAGVPSLVVSLWQVNDASTSMIMKSFYQYLYEGKSKDGALRQAKLDYLSKAQGLAAHPAFWSPFIQIGDAQAIQLGAAHNWWLIGGGIFVLLLLGIGFYRYS